MIDQAEQLRRRLEARAKGEPLPPPEPKAEPAFQPSPHNPSPKAPLQRSAVRSIPVPIYPKNACICPNCGSIGKPKNVTRGSIFIEIVLWLAFLIPGLIYSIWRLTTRHKACQKCLASNPIPLDSPRGRKLLEEYQGS